MSHFIQGLHMPLTLPMMQKLWTGRKQAATGRGGQRKGTGKGCETPRPLWGQAERPHSLCSPFLPIPPILQAEAAQDYYRPRTPGINSLALQNQSIQTSIVYVVYREAGWEGAATAPTPRQRSRSLHLLARPPRPSAAHL